MTWSLRVSNGDLVVGGTSYQTVTNENKLVQDFRHYLLHRLGEDAQYPGYGSTIDGGIENGREVESVIAETNWTMVKLRIEGEIRRIGASYQRMQLERAKNDRLRYNRSTLTAGEILAAVGSIKFKQNADQLTVTVQLTNGRDQQTDLALALPSVVTI